MEQSYKEKYEQAIERLKQWDREHPCAGYVLSDRDKFIFPELAESKDEKIRKRLITDFGTIGKKEWGGLEVKDILAWLEKQGDKKPTDSYCKENCKGYQETGKCFADGGCKAKREAEQKPEENKGNVGGISPNWSEEDEQHVDSLLKRLDALCRNKFERTRFAISEDKDWLKSLKGRVQPKQEWSEEDSQYIDDAFTLIGFGLSTHTTGEVQEWLLSLKGRVKPQWKPSDEQMNNK